MDKYLYQILKEINTIIIPDLGALTITNSKTGEIMVMPFMKHDDGQLAKYISEKENMSVNDAKNLIAKYVREIKHSLDKGEEYKMYQFGTFKKNEDGQIVFENWKEDSNASNTDENIYIPPQKTNIEHTTNKKEESTENKTTPIATPSEKIQQPTKTVAEKEEIEKNRKKLKELEESKDKNHKKKRKPIGFWIGISLLVLLLAGGTYTALNFNSVKQHLPFLTETKVNTNEEEKGAVKDMENTNDIDEEIEPIIDTTNTTEETLSNEGTNTNEETTTESTEIAQVSQNVPESQTEESTSSSLPYSIVVGAFSNEDNADKLVMKLKEQGYPSFKTTVGSKHIVSLKSYATKSEATTDLKKLPEITPSGWVKKW